MAKNVVIVESPAKAKTIKKYLGRNYDVVASFGHIRDLPKTKLAIDLENNFEPYYINIRGKGPIINDIKKKAKKADNIFLATDPDREGEAISYHLATILGLDPRTANRVTFNEITKDAVKQGVKHPRKIDMDLFDAQQARRLLDRLVGYKLSPFLWAKVRRGLSAGRVQSVAVRILVDREEEIRAFVSQEYWTVDANLKTEDNKQFTSRLSAKNGKKIELKNEAEALEVLNDLKGSDFVVKEVKKALRKRQPAPPFITSTLQQEASRRLNFQSRRTMKAAQELYEGVEVPDMGTVGLITYMRTDSLRLSNEALDGASEYIGKTYGKEYLPDKPRVFKSKGKTAAQDAHEAIRPTMPHVTPAMVKETLSGDQYRLYKLIWERFMASQMANALHDTMNVEIEAGDYTFKASGFTVRFDGFTKLYEESKDTADEKAKALPDLLKGQKLSLVELLKDQHFTQPPARYTEASLIKALEENGIGRPSTYAPTITTIISRGYVEREGRTLTPTQLGEVTTKLMKDHFEEIVDVEFSANMEDSLDKVEDGNTNWRDLLKDFYGGFSKTLEKAEKELEGTRLDLPDEETDVICDKCGRNMVIKVGRFGKFLACPGYPECKNTKRIVEESGGICPLCGGKILVKKSKKGKKYFGCEHNPTCGFMTWDTPLKENCPKCGKTLLQKMGRNPKIYCSDENCDYERAVEKKDKE